jgi:hypothetical protein
LYVIANALFLIEQGHYLVIDDASEPSTNQNFQFRETTFRLPIPHQVRGTAFKVEPDPETASSFLGVQRND